MTTLAAVGKIDESRLDTEKIVGNLSKLLLEILQWFLIKSKGPFP